MPDNALDILRARGFVQDITDEAGLAELFATERVTAYYGIDPTASSMHVGHLIGVMALAWLQRLGHRPVALAGGATGRIGDPSGRDTERELLAEGVIADNLARIKGQLLRFLDLSDPDRGLIVDNYTWTAPLRLLDFLRDVGKHFSVNAMIARESVRRRLESREQGLSFTEFSYQLLQAFDFAQLYAAEGCRLQIGGSDQWGNITAGVDLARRLHGGDVYGLVWPLLAAAGGRKMSKTAGGAVWLDPELTSPYSYYQFWFNTPDEDAERNLKAFTFLDLDEIAAVLDAHAAEPAERSAQRRLAEEATRIAHGEDGLAQAEQATAALFGGGDGAAPTIPEGAPETSLARRRLEEGIGLLELLVSVGAASSNADARRLVAQGGVYLNDRRVGDDRRTIRPDDLLTDDAVVLRVGKKRYFVARFR